MEQQGHALKCHQRLVRESEETLERTNLLGAWWEEIPMTKESASVKRISREQAESIILRYEWLGTLPANYFFYVGLFFGGYLTGAACFTRVKFGGRYSLLGKDAICLGRGACAFWAPNWAGSFLVPKACDLVARELKAPTYFVAFSDWSAGEIGTIYQACNWTYLGHKPTKEYRGPGNHRLDINTPRVRAVTGFERKANPDLRATKEQVKAEIEKLKAAGYELVAGPTRGKYAAVYGTNGKERRDMQRALQKISKPYPKRSLTPPPEAC